MRMRKFRHNRLWRDKLPQWAKEQGSIIHIKEISDLEYDQALREKLLEEARETVEASYRADLLEELADVFEVIDALCSLHTINKSEIEAVQAKKRSDRGGFYERKFVTTCEHPEGSKIAQYFMADPQKHPEITDEFPAEK